MSAFFIGVGFVKLKIKPSLEPPVKKSFILLFCCLISLGVQASDKVSIDEFAWLTGHWVGDGFGGVSEEVWGQPMAGSMLGLYRHISDDKTNFGEYIQINEEADSIRLRLKHFSADLVGWETKEDYVEFPFVSVEPGRAVFEGLVYELVSEDKMTVRLTLHNDGKSWEEVFTFDRVEP